MAISNYSMPMNIHNIANQPIRNRLDKYAQSDLARRARFEVSEGTRPAEYMGVYRYLPVCEKDVTTQDYIVIPKGRILSAVSTEDATPVGGIVTPSGAGQVYIFTSQTTGSVVSGSIDNSFWGYDENIVNLLVPCNGGTALNSGYYTADDVLATALKATGVAAVAGDVFTLPANAPIGVAYHDWYQDINGKYLNYRMWPDGGHVLCDWYVEVPYVKVNLGHGDPRIINTDTYATFLDKWSVNKRFTYLAINDGTDIFRPGVMVQSDLIGNYKISGGASSLTQTYSPQTVGRVIAIDNRFPKSGLEDVQTYPGSGLSGTQTAGIPKFLFDFVVACRKLNSGATPTVEDVLNLVQAGYYGVARINLMIA